MAYFFIYMWVALASKYFVIAGIIYIYIALILFSLVHIKAVADVGCDDGLIRVLFPKCSKSFQVLTLFVLFTFMHYQTLWDNSDHSVNLSVYQYNNISLSIYIYIYIYIMNKHILDL